LRSRDVGLPPSRSLLDDGNGIEVTAYITHRLLLVVGRKA
jgi:hypothetical protein